jgi:hypothetical protein
MDNWEVAAIAEFQLDPDMVLDEWAARLIWCNLGGLSPNEGEVAKEIRQQVQADTCRRLGEWLREHVNCESEMTACWLVEISKNQLHALQWEGEMPGGESWG